MRAFAAGGGGGDVCGVQQARAARDTAAMDIDTGVPQDEKLRLANKFYLLTCSDVLAPDKGAIKAEIMKSVEENGMSEWYRHFASLDKSPLQPRDDVLIERLSAANSTKLETIEAKIVDMEENMGESEVPPSPQPQPPGAANQRRHGAENRIV